jgi:predicted neutral ceramidase superfamily lipid hydrolase
MTRSILLSALLTGLFCAVFAAVSMVVTKSLMLTTLGVSGVSFLSGFLGSVFAGTVLGRFS